MILMENIFLKKDGSIEGHKTNFFNHLTGDKSEDRVFMKTVGKIYVSFCFDVKGHICHLCQTKKHIFTEFTSGKVIRICKECHSHINKLFQIIHE